MKTLQWQSMQNALCALLRLQLWLSAWQGVPCLQATARCFGVLERTIINNYINNNISIMIPITTNTNMIAMLTITITITITIIIMIIAIAIVIVIVIITVVIMTMWSIITSVMSLPLSRRCYLSCDSSSYKVRISKDLSLSAECQLDWIRLLWTIVLS